MMTRDELIKRYRFYGPLLETVNKPTENDRAIDRAANLQTNEPIHIEPNIIIVGGREELSADQMDEHNSNAPIENQNEASAGYFDETVEMKNIPCKICGKTYKTKGYYNHHKKDFRIRNICCICKEPFPDLKRLADHVKSKPHNKQCCNCGEKFPTLEDITKHIEKCRRTKNSQGKTGKKRRVEDENDVAKPSAKKQAK